MAVKEVMSKEGKIEAVEINYCTFYAYNGPYSIFGVKVGAHDGDWEHFTVRHAFLLLCPDFSFSSSFSSPFCKPGDAADVECFATKPPRLGCLT